MDFSDYAWTTSFQITKKNHGDVKILVRDDVIFPILGKDNQGYVMCFPEPKRLPKGIMEFQALSLNKGNEFHRMVLWQLFRASIFHLSQHVATSGFDSYVRWTKGKHKNLSLYVASIIEDAIVTACAKTIWTPFLPDIALANTVAHLRLMPYRVIFEDSFRMMAAVLSNFTIGRDKGTLPQEMKEDVHAILFHLQEIENLTAKFLSERDKDNRNQDWSSVNHKKLEIADEIFERLRKYGRPSTVVSLPHTESYKGKSLFSRSITSTAEEFDELLKAAFDRLGSEIWVDDSSRREVSQAFATWEARKKHEQKILDEYVELLQGTRFGGIDFPKEDYTEYLRTKELLSSPVRRILEKLRLLKNVTGEDFKQESGLVDLQEAIQVVASQSRRTDIFVREELQTREEAWATVIDASHSLSFFGQEVRGITLCLAETAKNLILDRAAWGIFAFSDKFSIVKDFTENYSTGTRARIGGLKHGGLSYIPDALAVVKNRLRQRIESAKIIIVVSDFFPSGDEKMPEELLQCIKQTERAGFGVIGIGLKSRAVKDYFRVNCVVDTPYDLMKKFSKAFLEYSTAI